MEKIIRGYKLNELLYSNDLFEVWKASHAILQGQHLRITLINNYFSEMPEVRNEINASAFKLGFAEHPYIIKNNDMIEENGLYAILSEDITVHKSLPFLQILSFEEKKTFVLKVLDALIYLNNRKIYHLSPELEDILIDENNNPRLCNYGMAEIFLKTKNLDDKSIVLSNFKYAAPELSEKSCGDEKAEVYSFGKLLQTVFGEQSQTINHIIGIATAIEKDKRFRNLRDVEKALLNTETTDRSKIQVENVSRLISSKSDESQLRNDQNTTAQKPQNEKNVFQILSEIESQKKNETQQNTQHIPSYQQQKANNTQTQQTQQQNDYNRTREAIKQSATQQNQPNSIKPVINTNGVIVLGVLSIIFGFIFSIVGFVLAIIGFNSASGNKKKAIKIGRSLTTAEVNSQSIGVVLCVIGLIVSIVKFLSFLGTTFG